VTQVSPVSGNTAPGNTAPESPVPDTRSTDSAPRGLSRDLLTRLFSPRSVAIVGASDRSNWSRRIHDSLDIIGYPGAVYYVNPRGGTAHGSPLHRSLADVGTVPDLVYIMAPAHAALDAVTEAGRLGVPAAIILSAGFAETGADGLREQLRVAEAVKAHGMALLGPNTLGFVNPGQRIALMPMQPGEPLSDGSVGVVSQSGNMAVQMMNMARSFDVGLSLLASTGNEISVTVADVIGYLADDDATKAIAVFLESVADPAAFRAACLRAHQAGKPVIVLKIGRSEAGARAAMAHTGAMVGDDGVIAAVFAASGVIRVDTMEDLLTTADAFVRSGPVRGRNLAVVTISGGAADVAADRAEDFGLRYPDFTAATLAELRRMLPDYATPQNPLDITGAAVADSALFAAALQTVAADPGVDVTVAVGEIEHHAPDSDWGMESIAAMSRVAARAPSPVIFANTTIHTITREVRRVRHELNVPSVFGGMDRALAAVARIAEWSARQPAAALPQPPQAAVLPAAATGVWAEDTCREFLASRGIPVVPGSAEPTPERAAAAVERLGVPAAMKIISPDIVHKSDVGGVALGITGYREALTTAERMLRDVAAKAPDARLRGILVSPLRADGYDLFVGFVNDPAWGQVMALGMGGLWAEALGDVRRIALPCSPQDIESAFRSLRAAPLLLGARGTAPVDLAALVHTVVRLADASLSLGRELAAFEVNPLRVTSGGIEVLDAAVIWRS
jgi:acyl-CoA synthetase (NDP forming)